MTLHFIQLRLGNKTYDDIVSTEGCAYVSEFKQAIKNKFSHLDSYAPYHLTLFQPDGTTKINPQTLDTDLKEIPLKSMVVAVLELVPIGSSKKHRTYRGMSTEASCRKYLDAIANELFVNYDFDFDNAYKKPTMGDLLAAKDGQLGPPSVPPTELAWWDYRKVGGQQLTTTPLPSLFSQSEWDLLKTLDAETTKRIHDARLPQTCTRKPFVVIPHSKFTTEYVRSLKRIAAIADVVPEPDDLVVMNELNIS